jgi:hypothetical protein
VLRAAAVKKRSTLKMDPEDRHTLGQYYRDDVEKLAELLDRDLAGWL